MKTLWAAVLASLLVLQAGCHREKNSQDVLVGTISGPETTLMQVAKRVAWQKYHIHIKIVPFTDFRMPNAALADGSLDANMFQHVPYLQAQIKNFGYHLVSIGKTFIYPMGIYSDKVKSLKALSVGSKVALPSDPSNEARALLLLQQAKLITLPAQVSINATPQLIISNPKHLKFIAMDAAELPRALKDVALAVINTNYAIPAGLSPRKDALFHENKSSLYANVVVVRQADAKETKLLDVVKALHSAAVQKEAKRLFGDGAIAAWLHGSG